VTCLPDETVLGLIEGRLAAPALAAADEHLDSCERCRDVVSQLARATASPAHIVARGHTLGRYVVGDLLGSGAMGRVYSAWQPELDRRVAIKVLREDAVDLHTRLVREAKAMARLDHPNVVGVHEVVTTAEGTYVVMDLVEGETLRAWIGKSRAIRETIAILIDIARGLAAVHAAGVVHRDIKPDNIIVGTDGRARLGDFGLARSSSRTAAAATDIASSARDAPVNDASVTDAAGARATAIASNRDPIAASAAAAATAIAGTPAYMAPEVMRGGAATPASDQFAFGVTAYELLAATRPFEGATWAELARSIDHQTIAPLRGVPAWLDAAIRRCLSRDPDRRFASMTELAEHLATRVQRRRPAVWVAGIAAAAVLASGATFLAVRGDATPLAGSCDRTALAAVWNADTRAQAAALGPRAVAAIERWTAQWGEQCTATRTDPPPRAIARARCLDHRRDELGALLARATTASTPGASSPSGGATSPELIADRLADALDALPASECSTADLASADPMPLDPDRVAAVREVERDLPAIRAALAFGDARPLAESATKIVNRARASGHEPTLAQALLVHAEVLRSTAQLDAATVAARDAVVAASRGHDDATAARAWIMRVTIASDRRELAFVDDHATIARGAIERAGSPPRLLAQLLRLQGLAAYNRNDLPAAKKLLADARTRLASLAGERSSAVSGIESALGSVARAAGDLDVAERHHRTALEIDREVRGPRHPDLARDLHNLAGVLRLRGDLDGAARLYDDALAMESVLRGPASVEVALTTNSRGLVKLARNDLAGARADFEDALAAFTVANHGDRAFAMHNLGLVAAASKDHRAALDRYAIAAGWYASTIGDTAAPAIRLHLDRARSLAALGQVASARIAATHALEAATKLAIPWIADDARALLTDKPASKRPAVEPAQDPTAISKRPAQPIPAKPPEPRRDVGVYGASQPTD
jgi:tRNA A-37 threonylcarbamoyl transferase component Bud32/tetratricopeptide (TPR) repeat protein